MVPHTPLNGAAPINYHLKTEVSITIHHQPCSTHFIQQYESKPFKKHPCYQSSCYIVATVKNTDD